MAERMNPEVKAAWVAALRSGEYKQGPKRVMCDGNGGWCCLGVLCDLYSKERAVQWENSGEGRTLLGSLYYPNPVVREWATFHEDHQLVAIEGGPAVSVAVHNDGMRVRPRSFAEIADAIEAQL